MDRGNTEESSRTRWLLLGVSCALVAVPFFAVDVPPSVDLPQHVAQIRLFLEALAAPGGEYRIQWFTPYSLSYTIVGAFYGLVGPERAGRYSLLVVALLWTAAVHALAWRFGRSSAAPVLASVFCFNQSLYWGFFTFLAGWPLFAAWLVLVSGPARRAAGWNAATRLTLLAALLFFTHALWFLMALGWLGVSTLLERPPLRTLVVRAAATLPVVVVAGVWYLQFSQTWYSEKESAWKLGLVEKLTSPWFFERTLGGLRGPLEYVVVGLALAWIVAGLVQHRASLREAVDGRLAAAGAVFLAVALVGPYNFHHTMLFDERWLPFAAVLLVLAAPAPALAPVLSRALAVAVLAAFVASTTALWRAFERSDLAGLRESLEALPEAPRVLGLNFANTSELVKDYPFDNAVAYSHALRGGMINHSFASFPHSLVVYRNEVFPPPWTDGLELFPKRVKPADFTHFDYVLVNATSEQHRSLQWSFGVTPVTTDGRWRLYRSIRPR
jgi:hypothetical protein